MNQLSQTQSINLPIEVSPKIHKKDFDHQTTLYDVANRIAIDLKYEDKWKKIAEQKERFRRGGLQ